MLILSTAEGGKAYQLGYQVGSFIGENIVIIAVTLFVLIAAIVYFSIKARNKSQRQA